MTVSLIQTIYGVYFAPEIYIKKVDEAFQSLHFETIHMPDQYEGTPSQGCITVAKMIAEIDEDIKPLRTELPNCGT